MNTTGVNRFPEWGPSEYPEHEGHTMKENWGKIVYVTICTLFVAVIFVITRTFPPAMGVFVDLVAVIAYMMAIRANPFNNSQGE